MSHPRDAPLRALDLLPPELVLSILAHGSISDLAAFSRVSRSCHALVSDSENVLYRNVGFNQGFTRPQTAGSTQALVAPPAPSSVVDQREELRRVVREQQSMSGYCHGVDRWKDFGKCQIVLCLSRVGVC